MNIRFLSLKKKQLVSKSDKKTRWPITKRESQKVCPIKRNRFNAPSVEWKTRYLFIALKMRCALTCVQCFSYIIWPLFLLLAIVWEMRSKKMMPFAIMRTSSYNLRSSPFVDHKSISCNKSITTKKYQCKHLQYRYNGRNCIEVEKKIVGTVYCAQIVSNKALRIKQ